MPLLLHSLTEVTEQIGAALEIVAPSSLVEIGSETGGMTRWLVDWAVEHNAHLVSIDPGPPAGLSELVATGAPLRILAEASPAGLDGLEADVWIIDGDHNYATVRAELAHVFDSGGGARLAILHDVGWPCGRRNAYYAPERIPEADRHEYSYRGAVVPGDAGLAETGFSGQGAFAWATREGGPRNGVLTAVEDTMDELGGLRLDVIPCIFGVGFLYPEDAPWASALAERLEPWAGSELLGRLEANRQALVQRVLELQAALAAEGAERDRLFAALHEQIGELEIRSLGARAGGPQATDG